MRKSLPGYLIANLGLCPSAQSRTQKLEKTIVLTDIILLTSPLFSWGTRPGIRLNSLKIFVFKLWCFHFLQFMELNSVLRRSVANLVRLLVCKQKKLFLLLIFVDLSPLYILFSHEWPSDCELESNKIFLRHVQLVS